MARGYPDYFGQSIFPKYGGARQEVQNKVSVPAGTTKSIVTVTGKGVMYQAGIQVLGYTAAYSDRFYLYVDNSLLATVSFEWKRDYSPMILHPYDWCIHCYDTVSGNFVAYFSGPISFDSSLELKYYAKAGSNPEVTGFFFYSKIE